MNPNSPQGGVERRAVEPWLGQGDGRQGSTSWGALLEGDCMNRQQPFISSMFESQTSDLRACSCPESLHRSWESSCSLLLASELSPVPLAEIGGFPVFDGPCHLDRPFSYRPRIPLTRLQGQLYVPYSQQLSGQSCLTRRKEYSFSLCSTGHGKH